VIRGSLGHGIGRIIFVVNPTDVTHLLAFVSLTNRYNVNYKSFFLGGFQFHKAFVKEQKIRTNDDRNRWRAQFGNNFINRSSDGNSYINAFGYGVNF
jgi:hypothetical protein